MREKPFEGSAFPVSEHGVWNSNPDVPEACLAEVKGFQLLIQRALGDT